MKPMRAWATAAERPGKGEIGLVATLFCVATLVLGFSMLADEVSEGETKQFDTLGRASLSPGRRQRSP